MRKRAHSKDRKENMGLLKKLIDLDDNLISFLCGIISNIPISLLFTIQEWGKCWKDQILFFLWIAAFILAVLVTGFAFAFTIEKIRIKKIVDEKNGDAAKAEALKDSLEETRTSKKGKQTKKSVILYRRIGCLLAFAIILFLVIIALWILPSVFKYL